MNFDDDAPPELVDTAGSLDDEEITVKVPITIVTGMPSHFNQEIICTDLHKVTWELERRPC